MNIIIKNSKWKKKDIKWIFGDFDSVEDYEIIEAKEIQDLLVKIGAYKSRSECRRAGREGELPTGYNEFKASKKLYLYIWNPNG